MIVTQNPGTARALSRGMTGTTTRKLTVPDLAIVPGEVYHPDMACAMLARQATVARATIAEHATCETVRALNHAAGICRATGPLAIVVTDDDVEAGLSWLAEQGE